MKFILPMALFLLTAISSCSDKAKKAEQELLQLNQRYDQALVQNNIKVLDSIYASDFIYTAPEGEVRTKEQELNLIKNGELKLDSAKSVEVRVKVYDNTAVVTGMFLAVGNFRNNPINIRERYTSVWVKKDERWQMVAEQGNFIKELK